MSRIDRNNRHTALMLLACAFAFVYLLAWQFQGQEVINKRESHRGSRVAPADPLPAKLEKIPQDSNNFETNTETSVNTGAIDISLETVGNPFREKGEIKEGFGEKGSGVKQISFTSLNAVPQSFVRLGIASPAGIMMDTQRIIVTTNTNSIKRSGESKTMTAEQIKDIGLNVQSLTFYNDPSWLNILVIMEVVHNQQSLLIQAPYSVWRDDKSHLNALITQLTQK